MADTDRKDPPHPAGQNLAEGSKPTPTQEENDLAAMGEHVIEKEPDGSPLDPGVPYPPELPNPPERGVPVIETMSPTTGPLPDVTLQIDGYTFRPDAVIVFDGAPQTTTLVASTRLTTSIVGFAGAAGSYGVLVRDAAGDSNVVQFTFTEPVEGGAAAGRRRR
ncbi:IPT/TIG domain-containing protein [Bradyrhizobium sp. 31Argb]|uniref:IPT/TIG domain-containing protein n=1 Tax=unclassified Bradyrhizobium TaxID=2631580 RepID=UPI00102EBECC|nr:IPT/TIG domain-containing protein [Bradyrhizobium sp. Leo170]TAI60689.1 hypothetical protein CWO89_39270 [Bradyrhizobium sp. Leo170]